MVSRIFSRRRNKPGGAGSVPAPMKLVMVLLVVMSDPTSTWCHTSIGKNDLPGPQTAQTLRKDAGDQPRWMDKRIHQNNGKALI